MQRFYFIFLLIIGTLMACESGNQEQSAAAPELPLKDGGAFTLGTSAFEQLFVANFKPSDFPYKADSEYEEIKDTIPADKVIKYVLEAAEKANSDAFVEFWGDEESKAMTRKGLADRFINVDESAFAVLNFEYLARLPLHDEVYTLVLRCVPTFMEGGYSYTYLVNYSKKGDFIDAVKIGGNAGYVDIQTEWKGKVAKEGWLEVEKAQVKMAEVTKPDDDFEETSYWKYQIEPEGKLDLIAQKHSSVSGKYKQKDGSKVLNLDEYLNEVLVFYQTDPSASQLDSREVTVLSHEDRKMVIAFPEANQKTILTFDENKAGFECRLPSGKVESYERMR